MWFPLFKCAISAGVGGWYGPGLGVPDRNKFQYKLSLSAGELRQEIPYDTSPRINYTTAETTSDRTIDLSDPMGFYFKPGTFIFD